LRSSEIPQFIENKGSPARMAGTGLAEEPSEWRKAMRRLIIAAGFLVFGLSAWAQQEAYRHGFVRFVEPTVTIQRAEEPGAEEAEAQLPFLPGDRIWTDASGRVEFQFADGSLVRLDSRGKLDYVALDEDSGRVILRLWSGGLFLRSRPSQSGGAFEIETPGGLVRPTEPGLVRLDVASGETRLSVYEGEATVSGVRGETRVRAGERAYAEAGGAREEPRPFDRWAQDDFDRWNDQRDSETRWAGSSRRDLPAEVAPFEPELERHGSWYFQAGIGQVWRPYVASTWRPYWDGRWVWTAYGWTWVPHEAWGWATSHYGSWGFSASLGWYWHPGRHWSPAWVSWSVSGGYVGWCPRDRHGHPVQVYHRQTGHAVPRGAPGGGWTFARREHLGSRDRAHRQLGGSGTPSGGALQVLDPARTRLGRDDRPVDASHAVQRSVRTRPTIGDTVPELRTDPMTTIPAPVARRRVPGRDDGQSTQAVRPDAPRAEARRSPGVASSDSRAVDRGRVRRFLDGDSSGGASSSGGVRPSDARIAPRPRPAAPDTEGGNAAQSGAPATRDGAARRSWTETMRQGAERARPGGDRGALRRLFEPLGERNRSGDSGDSARARSQRESPRVSRPSDDAPRSYRPPDEVRSRGSAPEGRSMGARPAPRAEAPRAESPRASGSSEGHAARRPRPDRD
jgi:hypothetical protein